VMWHMNQRLKPLFETDGVGKDMMSVTSVPTGAFTHGEAP